MKTSEFIKKWNEDGQDEQATRFGNFGVMVCNGSTELFHINDDVLTVCESESFTSDDIELISSYLQTKPENRKDERKWVIPWGSDLDDETKHAWCNRKKPFVAILDLVVNWKKSSDYQFTDSELQHLKSTQSSAIAQAIDIAKELVSDET